MGTEQFEPRVINGEATPNFHFKVKENNLITEEPRNNERRQKSTDNEWLLLRQENDRDIHINNQ